MSINANEETAATQPVPKSGDEAAPADPNVILKISDLSKDFEIRSDKLGEKSQYLHALSRVNLEVYKGETLGIIGESGCGKSTLGRCLVRLHEPTSGTVTFEGEPLDFKKDRARRQRRSVQMIFQDPYSSLNPRKTCAKIIEEPMIIHKTETDPKKREARVRKLMELVGLGKR
ncbi:MAG: ATP-binding cassette domain-containing protein [Coriobacteriia bacterium]|nr:ATP-binding cassette domain-containing protein [Coriobacteriia bacterium]